MLLLLRHHLLRLVWHSGHLLSDSRLLTLLLSLECFHLFLVLLDVSSLFLVSLHVVCVGLSLLLDLFLFSCELFFFLLLKLLLLFKFKLSVLKFLLLPLKLALFSLDLSLSFHHLSLETLELLLLLIDFLANRELLELACTIKVIKALLLCLVIRFELS